MADERLEAQAPQLGAARQETKRLDGIAAERPSRRKSGRRRRIEQIVRALAAFERASASPGERRAAEWIVARWRELGLDATVEEERAHGGYWWPLGLANGAAAVAGLWAAARPKRLLRRTVAAAISWSAASAVADEVGGGSLWFRRRLPHRSTWNAVAETGDRSATRTLLLVAHHDAAHSGLVFHPALPRAGIRLAPRLHERSSQTIPILYGVWLGPVLVALGSALGWGRARRAGIALSAAAAAAMANVGASRVVPGANDNLAAVAILVCLAGSLAERQPRGVRVVLLSTGSEESFSEGMRAFLRRHGADVRPQETEVVALECLGGDHMVVLEGEGMLRMRRYDPGLSRRLVDAAARAGIALSGPLRTVAATDALIAMRRGWRTATLASVDDTKLPRNYHWPTDAPDVVNYATAEHALSVCEELVYATGGG